MTPLTVPHRARVVFGRPLVVVAVVALAVTCLATPGVAAPKPPAPPTEYTGRAALHAFQQKLNAAALRILAAGGAGNASIVAAPGNQELRVYWNGAVPASVRKLAGGLDVPVKFLPALYSHRDLVAEAKRLAADPRVAEVAAKPDGSGLAVTVIAGAKPAASQDLLATARMPLTITAGQRPQAMFSRQFDTPAFWGGSRFNTDVGGCTNGFALNIPNNPPAYLYEITAGHCWNGSGGATIPGQPSPTGQPMGKDPCRDITLIRYPAGLSGRVYTGGFDSQTSLPVFGEQADFVGNLVTTSGATSGEHMDIPVLAVDVFSAVNGIACSPVGPLTKAGFSDDTCAVAPGDSGGPVYVTSGFPELGALGVGTITAGNMGTANCTTVDGDPTGANTVYYAPLLRPDGDPQQGTEQVWVVTLLTG